MIKKKNTVVQTVAAVTPKQRSNTITEPTDHENNLIRKELQFPTVFKRYFQAPFTLNKNLCTFLFKG